MNAIATEYQAAHSKKSSMIEAGLTVRIHDDKRFIITVYLLSSVEVEPQLIADVREYIDSTAEIAEPQSEE